MNPDMTTHTVYSVTTEELFRLNAAYAAIRDPKVRVEFLTTVEAWAKDQWVGIKR